MYVNFVVVTVHVEGFIATIAMSDLQREPSSTVQQRHKD